MSHKSLIGQKFGKILVIGNSGHYKNGSIKWECKCECGSICFSQAYYLKRGGNCCPKCNRSDFINQKIGKLTVVKQSENLVLKSGKERINWECLCECGETVFRTSYLLGRGNCSCKSCKAKTDKINNSTGYKDISGIYWSSVRAQAVKRGLKLEVDIKEAWKMYEDQNGFCALSGMKIDFAQSKEHYLQRKTTASLDRIDSDLGYVKENVQWIHKKINRMKSNQKEDDFINFCIKIAEHNYEKRKYPKTSC